MNDKDEVYKFCKMSIKVLEMEEVPNQNLGKNYEELLFIG